MKLAMPAVEPISILIEMRAELSRDKYMLSESSCSCPPSLLLSSESRSFLLRKDVLRSRVFRLLSLSL